MKLRTGGAFDAARARLRDRLGGGEQAAPNATEPVEPMEWHVQDMGARVDVANYEALLAAMEGR